MSGLNLRWVAACVLGVVGALLLVTPHHFSSGPLVVLAPYTATWGIAFSASALVLFAAAVLGPPPWIARASQLGAACASLAFGVELSMISHGALFGALAYVILGVGLAVAALAPLAPREDDERRVDLLPLVSGAIALVAAALLVLAPTSVSDVPVSAFPRAQFVLLVIGLSLLVTPFAKPWPPIERFIRLIGAATFVALGYFSASAAYVRWSTLVLSLAIASSLVVMPWLEPRLRRIDPGTLQARLAFSFAVGIAVPLLGLAAFDTARETSTVTNQALGQQQSLAVSLSEAISENIQLHADAVRALAVQPGLLDLGPEQQRAILSSAASSYPDVNGFGIIDATGSPIARSDGRQGTSFVGDPMFERVRSSNAPAVAIVISPVIHQAVFSIGAPIHDAQGQFAGVVASSLLGSDVAAVLDRADGAGPVRSFLVDETGRVIANPDTTLVPASDVLGDLAPVAALRANLAKPGGLHYITPDQIDMLSGYAEVPGQGWEVIVEEPASSALAGLRQGRDVLLIVLLLGIVVAAALGEFIARRFVTPLQVLAEATRRLGDGDDTAPLPRSSVTEIDELARQFGRMRFHLAQRTDELHHTIQERLVAEGRVRLRDEFIAAAAHELKTPLTSLLGHAQLLQRLSTSGSPRLMRQRAQSLESIDRQVRKLARLVEHLLDVGRIDARRLKLDLAVTDVTAIVWNVVIDTAARTNLHEFVIDLPARLTASVDPLRFERVIINVVDNAVKFSPRGGQIEIAAAISDGILRVSVRDHGIGVPLEHREHIFERSYQVHAGHAAGLGLGLHISREIIEQHGGALVLECPPDGGSRFTLTVPVVATAVSATSADDTLAA